VDTFAGRGRLRAQKHLQLRQRLFGRLLEDSIVESPSLGTVLNGIAVIRYEVDTGTQVKGRE